MATVWGLLVTALGLYLLHCRLSKYCGLNLCAKVKGGKLPSNHAHSLIYGTVAGTYLTGRRLFSRYAIPATLAVGVCVLFTTDLMHVGLINFAPAVPLFTKPTFSFQAFVGLAIPLCFVTMASQNAPGVAVLRNAGYETPANPLVTTTGIISFLLAPFGAHGINLAAITAAICTGREAHNDTSRQYVAGVFCGLFYVLIGTFGATLASVFNSLPEEFVTALAGLALLGALGGGLTGSFASEHRREPALITFLATTSGITFFGIGAPFWGLVAGAVSNFILFGNIRNLRQAH